MQTRNRVYLVRTPADRGKPFTTAGEVHTNKRQAIEAAKWKARALRDVTPARNRRVSAYTVDPGKRPSLLFQCHVSRASGRIISEEL